MGKGDKEYYVIGVAAKMLGIRSHSLRYYEKIGIIEPSRSRRNIRRYSEEDISYLRQVKALMDDLGISLAGAEIVLRMTQRINELQLRVDRLAAELERCARQDS